MAKKKILVLDDKDHAKKQIFHCMTRIQQELFELVHVESIADLENYQDISFFIAFVDFFLDTDKKCGIEALDKINTDYIIGFSSFETGSGAICEQAMKMNKWNSEKIYAIQKIKNEMENNELQYFFQTVIGENIK